MPSSEAAAQHTGNKVHGAVDKLESRIAILYTLQLPTVCRIGFHALHYGVSGMPYALALGLPVLVAEGLYALKLLRHVRTLQGRSNCFGRPHTPLPLDRLRTRLRYLIARYKPNAPFWQFVLWARQLSLAAVHEAFTLVEGDAALEAAAALGVLGVALALHVRTRPYVHDYQNTLETVLAASSMGFVALALAWALDEARTTGDGDVPITLETLETSMLAVLLAPAAVYLTWLCAKNRHRRFESPRELDERLLDHNDVLPSDELSVNATPAAAREEGGGAEEGALSASDESGARSR